ncbi:uncharacterized protein CMU_018350 [Cryptosporidium muris RN66]|uniref:Uncharacterized protein n=1 Tax=Cryptosporidium muris (strain RN66) TaxID=441375 RepID=B6AD74_CRYMR|nr:uncharacterized protein CMU_018350 [Cryptosporidium muris RN66]EEA06078.1 hypothetical protein CMU_018350 [Cryptosporidium muris RN66]|eukprot:XP_002140427.1 hypothetical protein [Cryptosporidium muris RN66]
MDEVTVCKIPRSSNINEDNNTNDYFWILESTRNITSLNDLSDILIRSLSERCDVKDKEQYKRKIGLIFSKLEDMDLKHKDSSYKSCIVDSTNKKSEQSENSELSHLKPTGLGGKPFNEIKYDKSDRLCEELDEQTKNRLMQQLDDLLVSCVDCAIEIDCLGELNSPANTKEPNSKLHYLTSKIGNDLVKILLDKGIKGRIL